MDLGGYQILDFSGTTLTGKGTQFPVNLTLSGESKDSVMSRLDEVKKVSIPFMFRDLNITTTGGANFNTKNLTAYGYRCTENDKVKFRLMIDRNRSLTICPGTSTTFTIE